MMLFSVNVSPAPSEMTVAVPTCAACATTLAKLFRTALPWKAMTSCAVPGMAK